MSDSVRPHRRQPTRLFRPWDSPGKKTGVGCHFLFQCMKMKSESEVAQSCPTLRNPMDCSPPGSFVHGIFQARVLEWGAIAFSLACPHGSVLGPDSGCGSESSGFSCPFAHREAMVTMVTKSADLRNSYTFHNMTNYNSDLSTS